MKRKCSEKIREHGEHGKLGERGELGSTADKMTHKSRELVKQRNVLGAVD